jgi:acyl carrier protein
MELKEFVTNFASQFDDTDPSLITPKTEFRSIEEWSSLYALAIIAMVDQEYGFKLKGDDILRSKTVEDLFNLVSSGRK